MDRPKNGTLRGKGGCNCNYKRYRIDDFKLSRDFESIASEKLSISVQANSLKGHLFPHEEYPDKGLKAVIKD
jgi:hypothetical protein